MKGKIMAELADNPQVAELLLLLWDSPDREAGIPIIDLPDSLCNADLLTACEGAELIHFARRNHCWHGGGPHRKMVVESGWAIAELFKANRKQAWQVLQEAVGEDVPDEIRMRVQLADRGSAEASRLALVGQNQSQDSFTLLDRFPATPSGNVAFLEFVRDEVHNAAEAKRGQLERGYSNATIESMVRGIKWKEAGQRVSRLSELPGNVVEMVASLFRRELSIGTLEQIDEMLAPPLRMLRDALESSLRFKDVTVVEPPELIRLRQWLALNGVKGHWEHTIAAAEFWHLEVDSRHRNIAFLLQQVFGGDPPESAIRDYLFQTHGILPSDSIDLVKLEALLRQDAERNRTGTDEADVGRSEAAPPSPKAAAKDKKRKRSTARGEGQAKLISALTAYHGYAGGGCTNLAPVNSNELARLAHVAQATANSFFNRWFGSAEQAKDGYSNYRVACKDKNKLIAILKVLNDEQRPGEILFGQKIPDEAENPDHRGDRRRKPRASELHRDDEN